MLKRLIIRVPTLVLWGERDPYVLVGNLNGLDEFVPNLQLHRIPEATHWVIHENPVLVNAAIRQYIVGDT